METGFEYQVFFRKPKGVREEAQRRFDAVCRWHELIATGMNKMQAFESMHRNYGIKRATLYRYLNQVRRKPRNLWLATLAPDYNGKKPHSEISAEAWNYISADYLRAERPCMSAVIRRARLEAKEHGWTLPSDKTIQRMINNIPYEQRILAREGSDALDKVYPTQRRTKKHMRALQAVNADGHRFDVFVRFPDGEIVRPLLVAFQDIYSGMFLSWRMDKSEHSDLVRLAYADLVKEYGVPERAYFDNGMAFAAKENTGGVCHRYRFKTKPEDPKGILEILGTQVTFVKPAHGQSKPIERAFKDFCEDIARHPFCAGAYTGNKPDAKPENYKTRAIDFHAFMNFFEDQLGIHNDRVGRRTEVANGGSFSQAFWRSYNEREDIRRLEGCQIAMAYLASKAKSVRKAGIIEVEQNRYWCEELVGLQGKTVVVRFDPDNLSGSVWVYHPDGTYIAEAPLFGDAKFNSRDDAREYQRNKNRKIKSDRKSLKASKRMDELKRSTRKWENSPPDNEPIPMPPQKKKDNQLQSETNELFRKGLQKVMGGDDEDVSLPPLRISK